MSVEGTGVAATAKIINQMGLIFRLQPTDDYGIDAQIETIENGYATGKLIAVQIKSGESYFNETTKDSIIYRGERKHYDYWLNHSLPVIIVLYNPTNDTCYWNVVNSNTATLTTKNWKLEIPFSNILDKDHNDGKGAKYTKSRLPVSLVYYGEFRTKKEAMRREYAIKRMTRKEKCRLVSSSGDKKCHLKDANYS